MATGCLAAKPPSCGASMTYWCSEALQALVPSVTTTPPTAAGLAEAEEAMCRALGFGTAAGGAPAGAAAAVVAPSRPATSAAQPMGSSCHWEGSRRIQDVKY